MDIYNPYTTYNKIFLLYTHSRYLHCDKKNEFILLPISQHHFDVDLYNNVNHLFYHHKQNCCYYYYSILHSFSSKVRSVIYELFQKLQQFKFGFSRFIHLCKLRYKKKYNTCTLLYEPFEKEKRKIVLYENQCVYTFEDNELFQIIESAFNYNDYGIPTILPIKNPYTNIPFSFYNLVYIYFELLKNGKNSLFFSSYFKGNFDEHKVVRTYKPQLYMNYLSNRFENFSLKTKEYSLSDAS